MIFEKLLKKLLLIMIAITAVSFFAQKSLAESNVVSIPFAMNSWIGYAPIFVASHKGYFGKYKLKYIHMDTGINAALLTGDVSIADLSMNQVISDNHKGQHIQIFMPIDYSNGADAIVATDKIKSVSDLRGLRIPLNTDSYSELLLSYALTKNKLNIKDVKMVDLPASDIPSALFSKTAYAGVTWSPHVQVVTSHPGYHILYSSKQAPGLISDSMCATHTWITSHPGAAKAIITGMLEGESYMKSHPEKSFKIIGKALGISATSAKEQYSGVVNPNIGGMYDMMEGIINNDTLPYDKSIIMVSSLMKETGKLSQNSNISPDRILYRQYVKTLNNK